jgi:hypothetical protein
LKWSRPCSPPVQSNGFGRSWSLRDQREAWVLERVGKYVQLRPATGAFGPVANGTHQTLMDLALARAKL